MLISTLNKPEIFLSGYCTKHYQVTSETLFELEFAGGSIACPETILTGAVSIFLSLFFSKMLTRLAKVKKT